MKIHPPSRPTRPKLDVLDLGESLKRLPADYCWQLLDGLLAELTDHITEGLRTDLYHILRKRDVVGYSELDSLYGLQCMTHWGRPEQGNPAVVRLLVSVIRKHEQMETVSRRDRFVACLEGVKALDSAMGAPKDSWTSDRVFNSMRQLLKQVLGAAPDLEMIAEGSRHGPGSSSTISYKDRNSYFKYEKWPYAVSPRAKALLVDVIKLDERWVGVLEDAYRERYKIPKWAILDRSVFWDNVVDPQYSFNRVTSVPKDGSKDRPIAIEPAGNIFLQLGVGRIIRERLRSAGIDLDRQQDRNRRAALLASRYGELFTIDLSNASDTVSLEFVRAMVPSDWFDLLYSLRSPSGEFPDGGGWHYAKISSMGNGFTFELETILFWCLSKAISIEFGHRSDISLAFGDDMIGMSYLYNHHCIYLREAGFQPNLKKSFVHGRAAESCGIDAFDGVNIRPVFLKSLPRNVLGLYNDRNRLNRWWFNHLGDRLPARIDSFFLRFIRGELLLGPDSDYEFDTYLHAGPYPEGVRFRSIARRTADRPAKDFRFRKLMHTLRSCTGEGGKFLVSEVSERRASVIERVVVGETGYAGHDVSLDRLR